MLTGGECNKKLSNCREKSASGMQSVVAWFTIRKHKHKLHHRNLYPLNCHTYYKGIKLSYANVQRTEEPHCRLMPPALSKEPLRISERKRMSRCRPSGESNWQNWRGWMMLHRHLTDIGSISKPMLGYRPMWPMPDVPMSLSVVL